MITMTMPILGPIFKLRSDFKTLIAVASAARPASPRRPSAIVGRGRRRQILTKINKKGLNFCNHDDPAAKVSLLKLKAQTLDWAVRNGYVPAMFQSGRQTMRYMVQSYSLNRGHLKPGFGQVLMDGAQALAAAERIIRTRDGVRVLEQDLDLFGRGEGDWRVIREIGHVPPREEERIAA